jgi:hypothetical protein
MQTYHTSFCLVLLFGLLGFFGCGKKVSNPAILKNNESVVEHERVKVIDYQKLAKNAVEEFTGKDSNLFSFEEISSSDKSTKQFVFSPLDKENLPPGSDIVVAVDVESGETKLISD